MLFYYWWMTLHFTWFIVKILKYVGVLECKEIETNRWVGKINYALHNSSLNLYFELFSLYVNNVVEIIILPLKWVELGDNVNWVALVT